MKLISIFFILLVVIGLILYFYLNTKDTFATSPTSVVTYTVEVVGTEAYKFKDNIGNYLKTSGTNNELNPTIILEEGTTYEFVNVSNKDSHPFNLVDRYNNSVGINNNGTITLTATLSEEPYYYSCSLHPAMIGLMQVNTLTQTPTLQPLTLQSSTMQPFSMQVPTLPPPTIQPPTLPPPTLPPATLPPPILPSPTIIPKPVVELPTIPVTTFPENMTTDQYNKILDLQRSLQSKITSIISQFNYFLDTNVINYKSDTLGNTVEPFIDTINLNSESFPKIKSYAEIYNKNVALLDDPNDLKSKTFEAYIYMQNNKIQKLRTDLLELQTKIQAQKKITPAIKSFKSMNTSQAFNIELYDEQNPNNSNSRDYPNYLIYGNNGCLEYEKKNGDQSAQWKFTSCDSNNKNQKFVSSKIDNLETYNSFINSDINEDRKIKNNTSTLFGFNVINPLEAKDQCLQLNNDGLSVMPCSLDFSQRFRESYSTVLQ